MASPSKYNFCDTDSSCPGAVEEEEARRQALILKYVEGGDDENNEWEPNTGYSSFESTEEQLDGEKTTKASANPVEKENVGNPEFAFEDAPMDQAPLDVENCVEGEDEGSQNANAALQELAEAPQAPVQNRRHRNVFTLQQRRELEEYFQRVQYPDVFARMELAERLGVPEKCVKVWFQNRRNRWRRQQRAQRLGCRVPVPLGPPMDIFYNEHYGPVHVIETAPRHFPLMPQPICPNMIRCRCPQPLRMHIPPRPPMWLFPWPPMPYLGRLPAPMPWGPMINGHFPCPMF